ncbi:MAG TPA: hypothetical protein DEP05_05895 [Betaproteobacteria bacterium]|nr:hypothetical protein [Betaproteobacteria bacterium]
MRINRVNIRYKAFKPLGLALLLLCLSTGGAQGDMKGGLSGKELDFIDHTFYPLLIKEKLCTSVDDCLNRNYIRCLSYDTLTCDVYGVSDPRVIREIFLAILNSGLKISYLAFWRTKHSHTGFFERPLLRFIDRAGGK